MCRVPHVEVGVSAGTVIVVIGLLLILAQPGAIPFTYAMAHRPHRRSERRQAIATAGAYLLGCALTLMFVAVFTCGDFPLLAALVLGYVPMWLFALLILRKNGVRSTGPHPE
ncbi:hypothetical protein ADL15_26005 [Actinoplanes awajinensis subsp. mycoplanecinus]|uniref:Uncharacterized protein n=1 Tax=Actinoplanes awajinensis subsp. mycoplanecinus TaxID=135947 RepID=A0A117MQC5_9ACTN|nr:hypothetical protein ADL15_26005 [Actinoplanes awajinensis subsp. mycoplanecinus]